MADGVTGPVPVLERVGRTFPTIWAWMRAGKFPRARDLGGRPAWIEREMDEWIASLPVCKSRVTTDED
jgi:predicted DNA-binding transcriptional regulator AlpA